MSQVLHNVHVKNRCAWLNHSSNPRAITDLVTAHPNVQLWFSGHFHLSHDYARSIGVLGTCAFVSTNVIGSYNRDGLRQSRVLQGEGDGNAARVGSGVLLCVALCESMVCGVGKHTHIHICVAITINGQPSSPVGQHAVDPSVDAQGYRLHTLDHDSGALRLDLEHTWGAGAPSPRTPEHPLDQNVQVIFCMTHCC